MYDTFRVTIPRVYSYSRIAQGEEDREGTGSSWSSLSLSVRIILTTLLVIPSLTRFTPGSLYGLFKRRETEASVSTGYR